ncbi:MAG: helix-turn-helix transcriptional regulator [Xanthobacteraceae bacterium]|nr:helix-turn-helix transcriptional regulator [Xanthobacteraceae bacterium]
MDLLDIGQRIKRRRLELGLTQSGLAQQARTSRARVDALENGRAPDIGFKRLQAIMNALGMDLRPTDLNAGRPTLDDLVKEDESDAPRLGR